MYIRLFLLYTQNILQVYLVLQQVLPVLWIVLQKWIMDSDVVAVSNPDTAKFL